MVIQKTQNSTSYTLCVTGASGYIGRHLIRAIEKKGQSYCKIGRPANSNQTKKDDSELLWSNIDELVSAISKVNNPILVNLAGYFIGKHQVDDIDALLDGNLKYSIKMFESFARAGCKKILNIGTSWEYGDNGQRRPENLYAATKSANALILDWYSREYSLSVINLKLNDTYGGHDDRKKLMPLLKDAYYRRHPVDLGFKNQKINLLYIDDVCNGIIAAANTLQLNECGKSKDLFLLGNETVTLGELIEFCNLNLSRPLQVRFKDETESSENLRKIWNNAPLVPNWQPKVDLNNGIRRYFLEEPM